MRVAVIGSRGAGGNIYKVLDAFIPANCTEIVSGGAKGADELGERYAREHGLLLTRFPPDYAAYGSSAPLRRNLQIIEYAQYVLALWDGASRGTAHVIAACVERGRAVRVVRIGKRETETDGQSTD